MTYFTSNELTGGHGVSPVADPMVRISHFTRAFLIYIRLATGPAGTASGPFLRIRQFYHDYGNLGINTPAELIRHAATIGRKTDADLTGDLPSDLGQVAGFSVRDVSEPGYRRAPFPYVFASGFDEVNFGWTPCHVIFLFDNPDFQFVEPNHPDSYNQPVVFRKNKAIQDGAGNWVAGGPYEENNSFFNLRTVQERDHSYLIMDNHMKEGTRQNPIATYRPTTGNPQPDWPVWRYCMDINVRIPQHRKAALLGIDSADALSENASATSWLTVVFDPPQNNGNGGGPG